MGRFIKDQAKHYEIPKRGRRLRSSVIISVFCCFWLGRVLLGEEGLGRHSVSYTWTGTEQ